MGLLIALLVDLLAWVVFKTLVAVVLALVACALVLWIVRNAGGTRL